MLSKPEITAFKELTKRELSISELADALNRSNPSVSLVVKSLKGKGFAEIKREGTRRIARVAPTDHAQYFSNLIENEPYVPWEKVLSYSNSKVLLDLWFSSSLGKDVSNTTRWRALRNLAAHGMLAEPGKVASNQRVRRFVEAYADYVSRAIAARILPTGSVVIWRKGDSYLFKTKQSAKLGTGFHETAISVFPRYGIRFITDEKYYFFDSKKRSLTLEDNLIHTLLIDPTSETYTGYALLLLLKESKKIAKDRLVERSKEYGLTRLTNSLLRYVETEGKERSFPLPSWDGLGELAKLYAIEML